MGRHLDIVWIDGYLYFGGGGEVTVNLKVEDGLIRWTQCSQILSPGCDSPDGNWLQRERDSLVCLEES